MEHPLAKFSITEHFRLLPQSVIYLTLGSTDTECGLLATFFRDVSPETPFPKQFQEETDTINLLYKENKTDLRNVVFLQISQPNEDFVTYDKQKDKFVMRLSSFINLIKAYESCYPYWQDKIANLRKEMEEGNKHFVLTYPLTFSGPADMYFLVTIHEKMFLELIHKFVEKKEFLILTYKNIQGSRVLNLTNYLMDKIKANLDLLLQNTRYKNTPNRKRPHQ